jgi:hypothetical protein
VQWLYYVGFGKGWWSERQNLSKKGHKTSEIGAKNLSLSLSLSLSLLASNQGLTARDRETERQRVGKKKVGGGH